MILENKKLVKIEQEDINCFILNVNECCEEITREPLVGYENRVCGVAFPSGIRTIGDSSFANFVSLRDASLPKELRYVGKLAFLNCQRMTHLKMHNKVTKIDDYAFAGCTILREPNLSLGLKGVGDFAFYRCHNFDSFTFPEGIRFIGASALEDCRRLRKVTIPRGVQFIGEGLIRKSPVNEIVLIKDGEEDIVINSNNFGEIFVKDGSFYLERLGADKKLVGYTCVNKFGKIMEINKGQMHIEIKDADKNIVDVVRQYDSIRDLKRKPKEFNFKPRTYRAFDTEKAM